MEETGTSSGSGSSCSRSGRIVVMVPAEDKRAGATWW